MDVKEHLGQFLSDRKELTDVQISAVEQLNAIFSQFNRQTLIAVVKYQSYFNAPGTNVTQHCIDFILDNTDIINDVEIEVICNDAYNIIDKKMDDSNKKDDVKKTEASKERFGTNSKDGGNAVSDTCLRKNSESSVTMFSDLPDSPEFEKHLDSTNIVGESKQSKRSSEIDDQEKNQSIDLDSLPDLDFPVRRSLSYSKISKDEVDEVDSGISAKSPNKEKTPIRSLNDTYVEGKASSHSHTVPETSVSFNACSTPKNLSSNRSILSQSLSNSPVKLHANVRLAVSQEVYLQWKIEYKKKLAEKYSKSLKLLRSLTPNPEAERQLRQAYEGKLKLVETGQKLPRHLIQPRSDGGQIIPIPISPSHINNNTPKEKNIKSSITKSILNSSPTTVPGVSSLIPKSPDITSPTSHQVHNTSFSEFVNRIVSENKLNTSSGSKADNNSSRTVSSITSIEDKDNVVTVVNTITISPTNNSVLFSGANNIRVPTTNNTVTNPALAQIEKQSSDANVLTPKGITAVNKRTAEQLTYINNNTKHIPSTTPCKSKQVLSQIRTTPPNKGLFNADTASKVNSNYCPQSIISQLGNTSTTIIRPSTVTSGAFTPIRSKSGVTSVKRAGPYESSKRSTPTATITSGVTSSPLTTKPQVLLNTNIPVKLSWTPTGTPQSTNTPSLNSTILASRYPVLLSGQSAKPINVPAVDSALSSANTPSKTAVSSTNKACTTSASTCVTSARSSTPTINQGTNNTVTNQNTSSTPASSLPTKTVSSSISATPTTTSIIMPSKNAKRLEVLQLFPDADPKHIDELLSSFTGDTAVNNVCSTLIDNPSYPRVKRTEVIVISPSPDKNNTGNKVDYYTAYLTKEGSCHYVRDVIDMLSNDFRMVAVRDITAVMAQYKDYYAPSHRALSLAFQSAMQKNKNPMKKIESVDVKLMKNDKVEKVRHCRLLKNKRVSYRNNSKPCQELKKEMDFVSYMINKEKVDADAEVARKLNEDQYTEAGDNIECGCCYGEQPFEDMVQCYDGHLFCKSCLQSYVREAVFGSGKLDLSCMTDGCDSNFPESQLQCCLEKDVLEKYQERVREENLNLADLEDLVRCPNCEYAAIMDTGDKVFRCQNIHCLKETCRFCKEDWKDHIGIPCEELEKKDEAALRKEYEEKMTAAKVRCCHKCKSQFMKEDGCNKMTCRCGATMCYVCRKPSIHYDHFCQHPRDPGQKCKKCKSCSLWTNPEEDDQRAVTEIQQEAQKIRREKGFLDDKLIGGTTSEPPAKKARTK